MSICLEQESCCFHGYWKQCFYYVHGNIIDLKQQKKFTLELLHSITNVSGGGLL